ncbi:C-type lectin lectoxin-Thr1-like, partial [Astyanax mexicanus]
TAFPLTFSSVSRQYHLITDKKSWTDAQTYCRNNYKDLATAENDLDFGRIQREAQRLGFTSEAWVGLFNDINSWRCSRDEVPLGSWTNWGADQPNNANAVDECVTMKGDGGWYDLPCSTSYAFICYDEKISGSDKYVYYSSGKTWKEAQDYCRQKHTDLACPSDDPQNSILKNKIYNGLIWIGFYRDGWKWSDNTSVSSIKWSSNQPDNSGGNDNCAYVVKSVFGSSYRSFDWNLCFFGCDTSGGSTDGWFDDEDCSDQRAFFCQSLPAPKKRQVMKVVLQSDQDMNDPTVKAALLVKIQQKLKEQGMMENATLRWKEQPDGSVFYKQKEEKSENVENNTATACEL